MCDEIRSPSSVSWGKLPTRTTQPTFRIRTLTSTFAGLKEDTCSKVSLALVFCHGIISRPYTIEVRGANYCDVGPESNSVQAKCPLVGFVEIEERWEAPDHPHGVIPHNWGGNKLTTAKAKVNNRRHFAVHDEFRGPQSGLCRSGIISRPYTIEVRGANYCDVGPESNSVQGFVEIEERWEAPDHPHGVIPHNWGGNKLTTAKAKVNNRRHFAVHDEFRGPQSGLCRSAKCPLVGFVEIEERWEAPDHPHGVIPHNWGGNKLTTAKAKVNNRRHFAVHDDEFRGPQSGLCRSAKCPLVGFVEIEERWEAPDHPHGVIPHNWGGNKLTTAKAKVNNRRHFAVHDEFRGPQSGLCRSGGMSNNK
ncbi:uncharacterized protein TNCV_898761 [Trichonephila clavipes]|nr:uncharacterized protein TNCV_898761 [Trichonephila clavipes]